MNVKPSQNQAKISAASAASAASAPSASSSLAPGSSGIPPLPISGGSGAASAGAGVSVSMPHTKDGINYASRLGGLFGGLQTSSTSTTSTTAHNEESIEEPLSKQARTTHSTATPLASHEVSDSNTNKLDASKLDAKARATQNMSGMKNTARKPKSSVNLESAPGRHL